MGTGNSLLDRLRATDSALALAGYGAGVTVVLSFVPFSSVLGGTAAAERSRRAGYLRGLGLGVLAGVFAAVPLAALFVPALAVAGTLGYGVAPSSPAYDVFLVLVGLLFLGYTVGEAPSVVSSACGSAGTRTGRSTRERGPDARHGVHGAGAAGQQYQ